MDGYDIRETPIGGEIAAVIDWLRSQQGGGNAAPVPGDGFGRIPSAGAAMGPTGRGSDLFPAPTGPTFRNPIPEDAPIRTEVGSLIDAIQGGGAPPAVAPALVDNGPGGAMPLPPPSAVDSGPGGPMPFPAPEANEMDAALAQIEGGPSSAVPTDSMPYGAEQQGEAMTYVIQPGDSLSLIGAMFGVTYQELISANPEILGEKGKSTVIHPDQKLVIPSPEGRGEIQRKDVRDKGLTPGGE